MRPFKNGSYWDFESNLKKLVKRTKSNFQVKFPSQISKSKFQFVKYGAYKDIMKSNEATLWTKN